MGIKSWMRGLFIAATPFMLTGCMSIGAIAPGVTLIDSQTGKTLAHVKDLSLREKGPWGGPDAMTLLPGEWSDKTFRTIYTRPDGWCVHEYDGMGKELGVYTLPKGMWMHYETERYAISAGLDRVVYCDNAGDIVLREVKSNKSTVLLERATTCSIEWIKWIDSDSAAVFVPSAELTPFRGAVLLVPIGGGQARILYKNNAYDVAVLSPDAKHLAVCHTRLDVVYLASGSEPVVETVPRGEGITRNVAWSPDGKSIVYTCGRNVELYSLESKRSTVVRRIEECDDTGLKRVAFLDNGLVCCSWHIGDSDRNEFEIFDIQTGKPVARLSFLAGWDWHVFDNGNRIAVEGK